MKATLIKVGNKYAVEIVVDEVTHRVDMKTPGCLWAIDSKYWHCGDCLTIHRNIAMAAMAIQKATYKFAKIREKMAED